MAKTSVSGSTWRDEDASADEGEGVLVMRLLARIRTLESQVASQQASLVTIQTRLGVINALLHLW